jgi:type I restriction enzyme S subunit
MLFRPNQELVIPRFLLLYVISPYVYDQAKAKNTGCGVGHVNVRDIKEFSINLPQINVQQSIVARLDALNEKCKTLQANYEKTLSLCDDLKQALLRKAFNGEI